jgi:hypothetical protein
MNLLHQKWIFDRLQGSFDRPKNSIDFTLDKVYSQASTERPVLNGFVVHREPLGSGQGIPRQALPKHVET